MRKINTGYQIILGTLAGINTVLASQSYFEVPETYYKVCSIIMAAAPIIWTNVLDKCKDYQADLTPSASLDETKINDNESTHSAHSTQSLP